MVEKKMIKKERKSCSRKKVATAVPDPYEKPKSWPNLPLKSTWSIYKTITGLGGITKSWISSPKPSSSCCIHQKPKQTWPQLVEINVYAESRKDNIIYGKEIKSSIDMGAYSVPWSYNIPFQYSTRNANGNVIAITGISSPAFACASVYCYHRMDWRMRNCRIAEPYSGDGRFMEFTNVIGFQGKFYAISRQGSLALIEDEGDSGIFDITALGRNRAVPCCKVSRSFREYLMVYKGVIYLVFLLSRASINVVDDVEVFRLDTSRLLWEKVDCLTGDTIFFVEDRCCVGVSANSLGLDCSKRRRGNCVYFTHGRADTWFVYDMKTNCISITSGPESDCPVSD